MLRILKRQLAFLSTSEPSDEDYGITAELLRNLRVCVVPRVIPTPSGVRFMQVSAGSAVLLLLIAAAALQAELVPVRSGFLKLQYFNRMITIRLWSISKIPWYCDFSRINKYIL